MYSISNFYLYNNPSNNKLTWIPWDNNEAFQFGKQGGALSLSLSEVGSNWPLIRYLMDQPGYKQKYKTYLQQFIDNVFIPSEMSTVYTKYYYLLQNYAYSEESGYTFINSNSEFDQAAETLKTHAQTRNNAALSYLL